MKRIPILLFSLFFFAGISSRAQVVIFNDNMTHERMGEIKVVVVDSLTSDPLPFASVYLVPFKDTTITNFTLTDPHGAATLDEVSELDFSGIQRLGVTSGASTPECFYQTTLDFLKIRY